MMLAPARARRDRLQVSIVVDRQPLGQIKPGRSRERLSIEAAIRRSGCFAAAETVCDSGSELESEYLAALKDSSIFFAHFERHPRAAPFVERNVLHMHAPAAAATAGCCSCTCPFTCSKLPETPYDCHCD